MRIILRKRRKTFNIFNAIAVSLGGVNEGSVGGVAWLFFICSVMPSMRCFICMAFGVAVNICFKALRILVCNIITSLELYGTCVTFSNISQKSRTIGLLCANTSPYLESLISII